MARPTCPDMGWLLGRRITDVHMKYAPQESARSGEWYIHTFTLDDGSVVRCQVGERDEADYVVMLLHHKNEVSDV